MIDKNLSYNWNIQNHPLQFNTNAIKLQKIPSNQPIIMNASYGANKSNSNSLDYNKALISKKQSCNSKFIPPVIDSSATPKIPWHEFEVNNNERNHKLFKHKNNYITTTKYNFFTYLPKCLIIQFARLPNIYFLASAIIQSIPIISPLTSVTAIVPWVFVLSVSMLREWVEDLGRYKYDKMNNKEEVIVLRNNQLVQTTSESWNVGEIIVIKDNSQIPCDTILWDSNWAEGICYVETSSLDGEKAWKEQIANKSTQRTFYDPNNPHSPKWVAISGSGQCDYPNPDLHKLDGNLHLQIDNVDVSFPIGTRQLLLKGSILKHTNWVVGIVVYTGLNNKIILNSKRPRMKLSQIEERLSKFLIGVFIFQMILCALAASLHHRYYIQEKEFYENFVQLERDPKTESFITFFTYFLLLNTLIPISLIVTLEIVKIAQGFFIRWDVELYSNYQKKFCKPYSVSLNEELGNVNYIFSDKTGTLTCNKMEFRYCIIGETCYEYIRKTNKGNLASNPANVENWNNYNIVMNSKDDYKNMLHIIQNASGNSGGNNNNNAIKVHSKNLQVLPTVKITCNNINNTNNGNELWESKNNGTAGNVNSIYPIMNSINKGKGNNLNNRLNLNIEKEFLYQEDTQINSQRTCNRSSKVKIIPITQNYFEQIIKKAKLKRSAVQSEILNKMNEQAETINHFWTALACAHECVCSETENGIEYSGVSPDDVELVKTASTQGYSFWKSPTNVRKLMIWGEEKSYKILNFLNFSSERKRMSIIIRDENNIIRLYTKGADCEIKKRLSPDSKSSYFNSISLSVNKFSSKGFRTLMIATKIISEDSYKEWNKRLQSGEMNLSEKQQIIEACFNSIESNLYLLGATMVEDKLQDNVPETIRDLRLAGIKIWVLTGDKADTAENIALSCNLISKDHKNFRICAEERLDQKTMVNYSQELGKFMEEFQQFQEDDNFLCWNNSNSSFNSNIDNSNDNKLSCYSMAPFSIWIEAPILATIWKDKNSTDQFLKIALCASTVICCRVSPLQKSLVVRHVKQADKNGVTLAIGDGGNDVSMIMEAHIGIGLYGEEGMRAVQASDFAIGEFKLLRRLWLFHGRTNSNRISKMILYFFYKNFLFTMTHFYFMFLCISSGQTIIDDWFITWYNLLFTALPLGIQACSDFDILESDGEWVKEMYPFLYKESRNNPLFCFKYFFWWNLKGLFLGLFSILFWIFTSANNILDRDGSSENLWYDSVTIFTNIIFSVSFELLISVRYLVIIVPVVMVVTSWMAYFCFCLFVHYMPMFNSFASILGSFSSLKFWFKLLWLLTVSFVTDYSSKSWFFFYGKSMATKWMILTHYKKLCDVSSYPEIIIQAKKDMELITKYNNYNIWKESSDSNKWQKFFTQLDKNALKEWNNKSKSQKPFKKK